MARRAEVVCAKPVIPSRIRRRAGLRRGPRRRRIAGRVAAGSPAGPVGCRPSPRAGPVGGLLRRRTAQTGEPRTAPPRRRRVPFRSSGFRGPATVPLRGLRPRPRRPSRPGGRPTCGGCRSTRRRGTRRLLGRPGVRHGRRSRSSVRESVCRVSRRWHRPREWRPRPPALTPRRVGRFPCAGVRSVRAVRRLRHVCPRAGVPVRAAVVRAHVPDRRTATPCHRLR